MNFREWLASLTPSHAHTTGEDIADSIALAIIVALLMVVVLM